MSEDVSKLPKWAFRRLISADIVIALLVVAAIACFVWVVVQ